MCHLSMKLSDTFDQNPLCTFDKIREKPIQNEKRSHGLTLRAKVIAKIKSQALGNKKQASPKKLGRGSLSNWCDNDADANICKTC